MCEFVVRLSELKSLPLAPEFVDFYAPVVELPAKSLNLSVTTFAYFSF
jgi:hypothetical protein